MGTFQKIIQTLGSMGIAVGAMPRAVAGDVPLMMRKTRRERATYHTNEGHGDMQHSRVDEKGLERNKYAPWGRGIYSGLPVENKACQDTRVNRKVLGTVDLV